MSDIKYRRLTATQTTTLAVSTRGSLPRGKSSDLHRLIYPITVESAPDVNFIDRRLKIASLPRLIYPIDLDGVSQFTTS